MKKIGLFFALLLSWCLPSYAWWDAGHMIVSKIAYERLTPRAQAEVDRLIAHHAEDFPNTSTSASCACFADDIKGEGISAFNSWHISSHPLVRDNCLNAEECAQIRAQLKNNDVIWAIDQAKQTLKNPKATDWAKGFMLRFLIHCVGDIHQPLHCVTLYSKEFPKGDRGGNSFIIKNSLNSATNLHAFWDSLCGLDRNDIRRPLKDKDHRLLNTFCEGITGSYPEYSLSNAHILDSQAWHQESYEIASTVVYQGIQTYKSLPNDYIEKGQVICKQRIALAGYRLAHLLNDIFQ